MRIITDIFSYCAENVPMWNTISISGYHIREAGSTAVQEVAFTLANGIAYVQAALEACLDVDTFGPRLSFFFNAHSDFLEEVAKYRAARRLWAKIMKERFKAKNSKSMMIRFHTQTAGCTLTAPQPKNNIVRVAFQAMSAVLGGTQSLHTNSMDAGMEVVYTGLRQTPSQIVESAIQEDVDVIAMSILSGAHDYLFPKVMELLGEKGVDDILVIGGGIIPDEDIPALKEVGIAEVFGPGTTTTQIIDYIKGNVN